MSVNVYTFSETNANGQTNGFNHSINHSPSEMEVDLDELSLRLHAEFDTWSDFVNAVDEFQKKTSIKLTIITSKKLRSTQKKRAKNDNLENHEQDDNNNCGRRGRSMSNNSSQRRTSSVARGDRNRFEYQYLKLTCKHYGKYTTTSKGIRPNQKTAKLECPTYLYAAYDNYKDKFLIKQMIVNCNHELKDEDVSLPKLLQRSLPADYENMDSSDSNTPARKKYIKIHNRNILKIPLESPTPGALIMSVQKKIKCNHDLNSVCQAATLTNEDLLSIHSMFADKSKEEQNSYIVDWITLNNYDPGSQNLTPNKIQKHIRSSNADSDADTVLIQFKLPTLDGTLINVCFKAFMSILGITNARVNEVICDYYAKDSAKHFSNNTIAEALENSAIIQTHGNKSREIETSVATILTSFNNSGNTVNVQSAELIEVVDGDNQQVMIIDTVDVPTADNTTIEDVYAQEQVEGQKQMLEEVVTTSTVVPVVISDTKCEMISIPWWRQMVNEDESTDVYCKIDRKRHLSMLDVIFHKDDLEINVFGQTIDCTEHDYLSSVYSEYQQTKSKIQTLNKLDELTICCGISDPQLKQLANQLKNSINQVFTYCTLSDAVHSPRCRLLYGNDWSYAICRDCYSILDNTTTVHGNLV